jgi:hypothetical protein
MAAFININVKVPVWLDKIFAFPILFYRMRKFGYPYRRIYLDEGLWTIVDPQDYYRYGCFKWCLDATHKGKFYAVRGARVGFEETKKVRLSREIMQAPKGILVDHHNGDSLDNRRDNLRLATRCQNNQNKKMMRNKKSTSSQFIGVYRDNNRGSWAYQLRANGKVVATGRFPTEIEAARARDLAAIKFHGEFAKLNFPKEIERSDVLLQDGVPEGGPRRLNLRSAAKSLSGRLANWLGARLNFPEAATPS